MQPDRLYLEDILVAADAIISFVDGRDAAALAEDDMARSAVLFKLVVMGEAASKVSRELRELQPEVPWLDIVAFRNLAVHAYFGVDWEMVWTTGARDVPSLRDRIAAILGAEARG
jgi:uncharacterized protein with HEPN domain